MTVTNFCRRLNTELWCFRIIAAHIQTTSFQFLRGFLVRVMPRRTETSVGALLSSSLSTFCHWNFLRSFGDVARKHEGVSVLEIDLISLRTSLATHSIMYGRQAVSFIVCSATAFLFPRAMDLAAYLRLGVSIILLGLGLYPMVNCAVIMCIENHTCT